MFLMRAAGKCWRKMPLPLFPGVCAEYTSHGYTNGCLFVDINECSTGNGGCSSHAVCNNTVGSFMCTCVAVYISAMVAAALVSIIIIQPEVRQTCPCVSRLKVGLLCGRTVLSIGISQNFGNSALVPFACFGQNGFKPDHWLKTGLTSVNEPAFYLLGHGENANKHKMPCKNGISAPTYFQVLRCYFY